MAEPNQPPSTAWKDETHLTLKAHRNHAAVLLNEAFRLSHEHGLYEAYGWCLNFKAGRNSTATTRFSVYPQAKLNWAGLLNREEDTGSDE